MILNRTLAMLAAVALLLGAAMPALGAARDTPASGGPRTPDNDNSLATATSISSGMPVPGILDPADDLSDFFKLTLTAGQTLKVSLQFTGPDAGVFIYGPSEQLLSNSSTGGPVRGDTVLASVNGTHYIEIRTLTGQISYVFTATIGTPATLTPGTPAAGTLSNWTADRTDWYRVWLAGNVSVNRTDTLWLNITPANASAVLRLNLTDNLGQNGTRAYNESWSSLTRPNVTAAASYTGWYYYSASCLVGNTTYTLDSIKFNIDSDGDNDYQNATRKPRNAVAWGYVDKAYDHYDWYRYSVGSNDNLLLNVTRFNSTDIFNVSVFDLNLNYVVGDDNSRPGGTRNSVNLYVPAVVNAQDFLIAVSMVFQAQPPPFFALTDKDASMVYRLTFTSPNHPPVLTAPIDNLTCNEDERATVAVAAHFTEPDGDNMTFSLGSATHFTCSFNASSGLLELIPAPNWFGKEGFNILAKDPGNAQTGAPVNLTVLPVNDAPTVKKGIANISMGQGGGYGGPLLNGVFQDNDSAYGDVLAYSVSGNGALVVNITPQGNVTISEPTATVYGLVVLSFTATDNASASVSATCNLTVERLNQPPRLKNHPGNLTVPEDGCLTVDMSGVFEDPDGDPVTILPAPNANLTVTSNASNFVTLVPKSNFIGSEELTLTPADRKGLQGASIAVNVTVTPVDDPPQVTTYKPQGDVILTETEAQNFSVSAYDIDSPSLNYTWLLDGAPAPGSGNSYSLVTNYSSAGNHTVSVRVSGGEAGTTLLWNVTVKNKNRPPADVRILAPANGEQFKEAAAIAFSGAGSDPDGEALTFTWYAGTKEMGKGLNISFSRLAPGLHTITLEASDGIDPTVSKAVAITVIMNHPPALTSWKPRDGSKFSEGQAVGFSVTAADADNDTLVATWSVDGRVAWVGTSFSLSNLPVGKHSVQLSVGDNKTFTNVTADIEITPAQQGFGGMALYAGIGAIVLAVAIVAGVALMRRKKTPPAASAPGPSTPPPASADGTFHPRSEAEQQAIARDHYHPPGERPQETPGPAAAGSSPAPAEPPAPSAPAAPEPAPAESPGAQAPPQAPAPAAPPAETSTPPAPPPAP